ncbi:MAG: SufD family Fe-S cluster assembly protein, partial [Verrucomicrobia bacterium]|nr:SufD family Fe-S cluster assembly protein [Verrucomicrobiota bacterium]
MVQLTADLAMKEADQYLETFERFEAQAKQPAWVMPLRKAGIARFAELGFPTLKQEDWRFTNVAPIAKLPFRPVFRLAGGGPTRATIAELTFGRLATSRLVFVNGHYAPELSAPGPQPQGVVVSSLAAALVDNPELVKRHWGQCAQGEENAFAALNAAFFQDGGFIYLPAGRRAEAPIHLLFISTTKESGTTSHPRNLIVAEKGSQATVLESYVSTQDASYFTNAVTELVLGEETMIEHCKFQDESRIAYHIAAMHARLGWGCNLISHSIATGARLSRNTIRTA